MKTPNMNILFNNQLMEEHEFYNIPLLGEVLMEDHYGNQGQYNLGELIRNFRASATRVINVRALDNSLASDGILEGDFLTITLQSHLRNGEIAAVKLGEKIFIRKIYFKKNLVRLETSDPAASPLIIDPKIPGFEIVGKVTTVFREL